MDSTKEKSAKDIVKEVYVQQKHIYLPGTWKEDSDKFFGPSEAVIVWKSLLDQRLIPPVDSDLLFVSASSNLPTHEAAIFRVDSEMRSKKSSFLVGDIGNIDPSSTLTELSTIQSDKHKFKFFKWDAEHLPVANGKIDVIWDRKGWLWFLADRGIQGKDNLIETFANYHRQLKPGGIIVIDAITEYALTPSQTIEKHARYIELKQDYKHGNISGVRPSELLPDAFGQYEFSTVELMDKIPKIWKQLETQFDIQNVGTGIFKNRVLVKK